MPIPNSQMCPFSFQFFSCSSLLAFPDLKQRPVIIHLQWPELFALTAQTWHVFFFTYVSLMLRLFTFWPSFASTLYFYAAIWYKTLHTVLLDWCKQQTFPQTFKFQSMHFGGQPISSPTKFALVRTDSLTLYMQNVDYRFYTQGIPVDIGRLFRLIR